MKPPKMKPKLIMAQDTHNQENQPETPASNVIVVEGDLHKEEKPKCNYWKDEQEYLINL